MERHKEKTNKAKSEGTVTYQKPKLIKLNRIQRRITASPG